MTTTILLGKDKNSNVTYGVVPSDQKFSATLLASTNTTITVPTSYENWEILFSIEPGASVWVAYNTAASAPVGNTFASTSSELNPSVRTLKGGDVINCLTNDASAVVGIMMYVL